MDPGCVGSKFDQNGDVKSLSNPFHHMQGHWRIISWSRWRKITLQLHHTTCLSTHLRPQTLSGPSWVYQKQNRNDFGLVYYYVWLKSVHYSVHVSVAVMTVEWKTAGILTKQAKDGDHSESLQIRSDWTHICQSHNLQHDQPLLAKDTQLSQLHYFLGCAHEGSHLWQIFKLKRLQ